MNVVKIYYGIYWLLNLIIVSSFLPSVRHPDYIEDSILFHFCLATKVSNPAEAGCPSVKKPEKKF